MRAMQGMLAVAESKVDRILEKEREVVEVGNEVGW